MTNFQLKNNDMRLLNRDLLLSLCNLLKIKNVLYCTKKKNLTVLRSPFVHNKTREQFKIDYFNVKFQSLIKTNILISDYYSKFN